MEVLPICIAMLCLYVQNFFIEESSSMFSEIIQIATVVGTIGTIIIAVVTATKKSDSKTRDYKDFLSKEHNNLSKEHNNLSKEHNNLSKEHNELSQGQLAIKNTIINEHTNIDNRIGTFENNILSIYNKEKAVAEEREKHLTPEMIEIKNIVGAVNSMEQQLEKLNTEVVILRKENTDLKVAYESAKKEINELQAENDRLNEIDLTKTNNRKL